ncbi:MAG: hypothetical protein M3347_15360, partial [Armatimonadota bacterium]|nr:hypothetical protein [Armatimonadota bacterium]
PETWRAPADRPQALQGLTLYRLGRPREDNGVIALDPQSNRVVAFTAPRPRPPLPPEPIPLDRAREAAEQFGRAYQPELFKAGGTVQTEVEPLITPDANYLVRLQRVERDVLLPVWAEVGVRASDGKIAGYREHVEPVTVDLAAEVTLEKAREAVATKDAALAGPREFNWLSEKREVVTLDGKQYSVWTLVAEVSTKPASGAPRRKLTLSHVDAHSGELLKSGPLGLLPATYRQWVQRGGKGVPLNPQEIENRSFIAVADTEPRWSPDGQQIAFLSNRARPGYPLWWEERPRGLFVVNADGSDLRVIAAEAEIPATWSPNSRRIAYRRGRDVLVYDLESKATVTVPPPKDDSIEPHLLGWLTAEQLLLGWLHNGPGGTDLVAWQPRQPEKPPYVLAPDFSNQVGNDWAMGKFTLSADGQTLYFTWMVPEQISIGTNCRYALYRVPVRDLKAKPVKISGCVPASAALQPVPQGLFITGGEQAFIVDTATGTVTEWKQPEMLWPVRNTPTINDLQLSPDGQHLVFAHAVKDTPAQQSGARVLSVARIDGSEIKALTGGDSAAALSPASPVGAAPSQK